MNIKRIFGENLKHYRKKLGLTQEELAEKVGVGTVHLGNIETGKKFVSAELLESLSVELKVSPSALFYTPKSNSYGDNFLDKLDSIVNEHHEKLKKDIRDMAK
ncbi:MAG: helix-turn-helix transcriptional regulator [Spirochaetes bacterium]|nr:helix-turn-helix transcriptional regulator [Spirochaetota bacterium]